MSASDPKETTTQEPPAETRASAPDPVLTLPARRLAGSSSCLNCGTPLQGPFCHYCGQPDRNFMRFFPALMREFLAEFLDLDSRFARTMKPLVFKPGRLTRDYLEGRRFRYTPPLRLYLFASIGFFLLAATLSTNAIRVGVQARAGGGTDINISGISANGEAALTAEELRRQLDQAGVPNTDEIVAQFEEAQGEEREPFAADQIMVAGKPWNRETNPVELLFLPDFANEWINDEIEESPQKARRINENPNLILEQVFDLLPGTAFVMLPVFALLLKFWYLFARRYYIEHLMFALHLHAFLFVSLIAILLLNLSGSLAASRGLASAGDVADWLVVALSIWIPLYLLLALRHVYQQGWFMTIGKFAVVSTSYTALLAISTSVVAVLGFVLL